jgi:hypothetical protein
MKTVYRLLLLLLICNCSFAQQKDSYYIDILFFEKVALINPDAKANGYYNKYTNQIILEQQAKDEIYRQKLDTNFNVINEYVSKTEFSLVQSKKKSFLYKEFCTANGNFELYHKNKELELIKLNFDLGKDEKLISIPLKKYYEDENLLATIPLNNNLNILTYTALYNRILSYEYDFALNKINYREFTLPKMPLTKEEINERGEYLAVNYSKKFESNLYTSPLYNTDRFQLHTEAQLFYDKQHLFFLLSMPYRAGYHLLKIDVLQQKISFENFIVNKMKNGFVLSNDDMLPVATLCDSLLIIQNSDYKNLEYHFYNLFTKQKLNEYIAKDDSSFNNIVQSPLKKFGGVLNKEKEKEIKKVDKFLKQKNKGLLFLKAYKEQDTLAIIFGSYQIEEGTSMSSPLGFYTLGRTASYIFSSSLYNFFLPHVYSINENFLYATSLFSYKNITPYKNVMPNTLIDRFISDKRMDDVQKKSSFLFEMNKKVYMGIFNIQRKGYEVYVY